MNSSFAGVGSATKSRSGASAAIRAATVAGSGSGSKPES